MNTIQSPSAVLPPTEQSLVSSAGRIRWAQIPTGIAALFLVLGIVNPDHFPPWTSYHSEVPGFAAGLLLLLAGTLGGARRLTAPVIVTLALAGVAWVQHYCGLIPFAGDAWVASAYLAVFASAWWWAASDRDPAQRPPPLDLVIGCLVAMAMLGAFQALLEWGRLESWYHGWIYEPADTVRSTSNFGQPNLLATLMLMATAGIAVWVVRGRLGAVTGWLLIGLFGVSLVTAQSRTGLLSATVMVAALACCSWFRPALRRWSLHGFVWLALIYAGTWALQAAHVDWGRPPLGTQTMASVGLRPVIWRQLLAAVTESPWVGYGWLQVSAAQQLGATHYPGVEQVNYSHNVLLDALVMLGVPLALALLAAAGYWFVRRLPRAVGSDPTPAAALFILLPFLIHTQLELPHAYSFMLVIAGILLGTFERHTRTPGDWTLTIPRLVPAAATLASVAMLAALAYEYAVVEEDFRVNRFENRRIGETPSTYVYPELKLLTQFDVMLRAMRVRAKARMSEQDLQVLQAATRRFTWAPLEFRTALAFGLNGKPEEAARHLRVITNMFPPEIRLDGRENWEHLQQEHPELRPIPYPPDRRD